MSRFRSILVPVFLACIAAASTANADIVVGLPPDSGSGNEFPFGVPSNGEYQQIYNADQFPGTITITDLSFFNTQFNPGGAIIDTATYTISLSTSPKAVNGLDVPPDAGNIGPDNKLFFSGILGGPINAVTKTLEIDGAAFTYDPTKGNLLIDIVKTGSLGNGDAFLDARNGTFGDISSRSHTFGAGFESYGLVTGFSTMVIGIPEPSTLAIGGLGALTMLGFACSRRGRGTEESRS